VHHFSVRHLETPHFGVMSESTHGRAGISRYIRVDEVEDDVMHMSNLLTLKIGNVEKIEGDRFAVG